jgi:long-chain acyl-CoA synthetase
LLVSVIIYTSGTTGHPKGAMLTHKNLISNAESTVSALLMTENEITLNVLPLFHSFAWTVNVLSTLMVGGSIVIMENFVPKDAIRIIEKEQITLVTGVPAMFNYYLMVGSKESFESIRVFVSGGASLPVEIIKGFKEKMGYDILEGYGLSEASPVVTINPLNKTKAGCIGIPIKNIEVRVVDTDGNEVPIGEKGELLVKGPNVMKGYYNLPEITAKTIIDDWLHPGDVAIIDEDGYVAIVDRIKDIIIVNGFNVYPREVEEVIYSYDGVLEAAVVGDSDPSRGEIVLAFVVPKDPENFDSKALKSYLRDHLASFKLPRKIIIKDGLPKNATGKILKKDIKQ